MKTPKFIIFAVLSLIALPTPAHSSIDFQYQNETLWHKHLGCPANSLCEKAAGMQRKKWVDFIFNLQKKKGTTSQSIASEIEIYRLNNGLPCEHWTAPLGQAKTPLIGPILWESSCPHHRQESSDGNGTHAAKLQSDIFLGLSFIKNTLQQKVKWVRPDGSQKELPLQWGKDATFQLDPLLVSRAQNAKIDLYFLPQGDRPVKIESKSITLVQEAFGLYYGLKIAKNGRWKVVTVPKNAPILEPVECPSFLKEFFLKQTALVALYPHYECLRYQGEEKGKGAWTLLSPQSCPF